MRGQLARQICQALVRRPQKTPLVFDQPHVWLCLRVCMDRDKLVAKGKASELSAAVVFLPEHTLEYGKHGSDKCFCEEMYGCIAPCGCKWFETWRQHVEEAVARKQRLQVFFSEGCVGQGTCA